MHKYSKDSLKELTSWSASTQPSPTSVDTSMTEWVYGLDPTTTGCPSKTNANAITSVAKFVGPTNEVEFLDVRIKIKKDNNNKISFETASSIKPLNLQLYVHQASCHPPGIIKGLIFGTVHRFWLLNSCTKELQHAIVQFYRKIIERGYEPNFIKPIFRNAIYKYVDQDRIHKLREIQENAKNQNLNEIGTNPSQEPYISPRQLFLHTQFHPNNLSRGEIQKIYRETFGSSLDNYTDKLTVAYSRPKNLRDLVAKAKVLDVEGAEVSKFFDDTSWTTDFSVDRK